MEPRFVLSVLTFLLLQLLSLRALGEDQLPGSKNIFGNVGSSVLLDPKCESVLNDSDILWVLTVNGKDPVTILDYKENHHDFVPSEQFKSRLYLNSVTLSLTINNLQLADQGNYSITVNGFLAKTIKLFVYDMRNPIELAVAVGSSILLPGFTDQHFEDVNRVKWTFSETQILNYDEASQTASFIDSYKNRCVFYRSNGSLLLRNITLKDEGLYTVQINLNEIRSKMIHLKVFEPVPEPSISSNSTYVDTAIGLDCRVTAKKLSSVLWWKDGKVITNDQRYQLTEDNRTMVIKKATKSDCGMYTCTVENAVSKKNSSHSLAIYGLPPLIHYAMELSIVALIFAAANIFCIIVQCLRSDKQSKKNMLFSQFAVRSLKLL
ncbi:hepatocyte cell adhesion molecule-like [Scyliorhinus canicula]|uniref:hepatocyte cell adhesion molecule-like n=1 Tax=Scyliorhinus canicula TaxID=7830 RepID=UPI0018F3C81D|nr:hepatocyte cell adhesion molecule-like [Scyliorhinus canicula]